MKHAHGVVVVVGVVEVLVGAVPVDEGVVPVGVVGVVDVPVVVEAPVPEGLPPPELLLPPEEEDGVVVVVGLSAPAGGAPLVPLEVLVALGVGALAVLRAGDAVDAYGALVAEVAVLAVCGRGAAVVVGDTFAAEAVEVVAGRDGVGG